MNPRSFLYIQLSLLPTKLRPPPPDPGDSFLLPETKSIYVSAHRKSAEASVYRTKGERILSHSVSNKTTKLKPLAGF